MGNKGLRVPLAVGDVLVGGERCALMAILNATPDSFFDGGKWNTPERAAQRARTAIAEGARILDVGAASSRPGSTPVSEEEELRRIVPVLEAVVPICAEAGVPVSADTTSAAVAREAVRLGARIVNDVSALGADPAMAATVAELSRENGCAVVLNHPSGGNPEKVKRELLERAKELEALGMEPSRICLDPGIGFGKTAEENYDLLAATESLCATGYPVLVGVSRKSLFGKTPGLEKSDRLVPSVVVHLLSACAGACIVRAHDVAATREALDVLDMFAKRASVRSPFVPADSFRMDENKAEAR